MVIFIHCRQCCPLRPDRRVPVAAHAHAAEGIKQAVLAGVRSIEHGTFIDAEASRMMAKRGTFLVPTIYVGDYFAVTGDLGLQASAQLGLDFIALARNPYFAWRYGYYGELLPNTAHAKSVSGRSDTMFPLGS